MESGDDEKSTEDRGQSPRPPQPESISDESQEDISSQSDSSEAKEGNDDKSDEETQNDTTPRRRRQRKCARIVKSYVESDDNSDSSENASSDPASDVDDDVNDDDGQVDDDGSDDDDGNSSDDEQDVPDSSKEKDTKRKRSPEPVKAGLGDTKKIKVDYSSLKCPRCSKVLKSEGGLKYHIEKFVCRPKATPKDKSESETPKRKRQSASPAEDKVKKTRFRGSKEDRTCKNCKKVFTSVLGLDYHVQRKVCSKSQGQKDSQILLPLLSPGDLYITSFGIVKVLSDDRATPLSTYVKEIKLRRLKWSTAKTRQEQQLKGAFVVTAGDLRHRRELVNSIYDKGRPDSSSIFTAYFGGHPSAVEKPRSIWPKLKPLGRDPAMPEESYPDRIVECQLVSDQRLRYEGLDDKEGSRMQEEVSTSNPPPFKLYLRRALLTERYSPEMTSISCQACGKWFCSAPGARYHINNEVCKRKSSTDDDNRAQLAERIEKRKIQVTPGRRQPRPLPPRPRSLPPLPKQPDPTKYCRNGYSRHKKRPPRKKETAVYPTVMLFLGFKFVKHDVVLPKPPVVKKKEEAEFQCHLNVEPPDALLQHLQKELETQQRKADDQKYGVMYQEVFKSLSFEKPKKRIVKKKPEPPAPKKRRRRRKKIKPPPPPKPVPRAIDVRALVDEVDSGRYPSMKRYHGDNHDDFCFICKKEGELLCCDFCTKAIHWKCMLEKFTIKPPEPEDDFMCHRCCQYILHRRARAEKRRLDKEKKLGICPIQQEKLALEAEEQASKEGNEYTDLAAKGQETSELIELLQDARLRLLQCIEVSKINDVRRGIMEY